MAKDYLDELLRQYKNGEISHENMLAAVRKQPYIDMGFAKIDTHRKLRVGVPEVIYGAGKTKEQIYEIALKLLESGEKGVLITRMDSEKADYVTKKLCEYKTGYDSVSGVCIIGEPDAPKGNGKIVIVSAGTSDMAVAEEAAITAATLGNEVLRIYDAGVAGLHRLLDHMDEIMEANVVIAVAGMEGALASVVGGLVPCPVIAVPTSVGYGANFGGLSALLAMLNSCACGVSVVNIDNGFGAAYQASLINHLGRNDNENNVF